MCDFDIWGNWEDLQLTNFKISFSFCSHRYDTPAKQPLLSYGSITLPAHPWKPILSSLTTCRMNQQTIVPDHPLLLYGGAVQLPEARMGCVPCPHPRPRLLGRERAQSHSLLLPAPWSRRKRNRPREAAEKLPKTVWTVNDSLHVNVNNSGQDSSNLNIKNFFFTDLPRNI